MTDFRALCAELVDDLELCDWPYKLSETIRADINRARAALAEPQPEEPTDEELYDYWISPSPEFECADPIGFARAVLARWGNPAPQPPAEKEVEELVIDELARRLRTKATTEKANRCHYSAILLTRAAELLQRLSPPQPIPVSERLPEPKDCDAEGRCWIHMPDMGTDPSWRLVHPRHIGRYHTHWIPAHALPLPTAND